MKKTQAFAHDLAEALFQELSTDQAQDRAVQDLVIARTLLEDRAVKEALTSEHHPLEKRVDLLERSCKAFLSEPVLRVLALLLRERAFEELPFFLDRFTRLREATGRAHEFLLTTAHPIASAQRQALEQALKERFGSHILLQEKVDHAVLGGVKLGAWSWEWDATVAGRLKRLARAFGVS